MFARYEIDIRVNGSSIWDSSAEVQVTDTTTSFNETGTYSLGGMDDVAATYAAYAWNTFSDTIDLGTFAVGDTFLLEYDLRTLARGNAAATGCAGGGQPDGIDRATVTNGTPIGGPCGTAISQSGDPFGVNPGGNTSSVSGAVAAPEPATLAILAAGLVGLGAVRRRRQ